MNNAGEHSPSLGYFYLALVFFPAVMYILKEFLILLKQTREANNQIHFVISDAQEVPVMIKTKQTTKKEKPKHKKPEFKTDENIMEGSRKALIGLGFKAKEARELVQRLCLEHCYLDEADLISDCFRKEDE